MPTPRKRPARSRQRPQRPATTPPVHTPVQPPTLEGPRAAWIYARLAASALYTPLLARYGLRLDSLLRWMDAHAGHMYLLLNAGLYGYAALAFLARIPGLTAGRSGLSIVDHPFAHAAWGVSVLLVCLSQLAALASVRIQRYEWAAWRISAVITAMWATAYWVVIWLVSFQYHSYSGVLLWGWVVGIHLLFVRNHPVPLEVAAIATTVDHVHTHAPSAHHFSPHEEAALLDRLQQVADDDGNGSSGERETKEK